VVAPRHLTRPRTAACAALMAGVGLVFAQVLVPPDTGDNAYLLLLLFGRVLALPALVLILATVWPDGALRGLALRVAAILLVVGLLTLVVMLPLCVLVATQPNHDFRVPLNHLLGAILLLLVVPGVYVALWRPRARR
jgi:hypothetical protein